MADFPRFIRENQSDQRPIGFLSDSLLDHFSSGNQFPDTTDTLQQKSSQQIAGSSFHWGLGNMFVGIRFAMVSFMFSSSKPDVVEERTMRQNPIYQFFIRLTLLSAVMLIGACSAPRPEEKDASSQPETAVAPSNQTRIEAPLAETVPCPVALPEGDVEGTSAYCGQIAVPENWEDPAGKQIALTYAVLKATDEDAAADPIVYFEGGPGISALENLAGKGEDFAHLRRQHDMIFWDQRGNFYSAKR